jgi:hypothetical protein
MRSCRNISGNWDVSIAKFRVVVIRPEPLLSAKVTSHKPPITNPANFLEPCFRRLAVWPSVVAARALVTASRAAGLTLLEFLALSCASLPILSFLLQTW